MLNRFSQGYKTRSVDVCQFSEGNKQQNRHKNMAALGNFGCYPCSCMMVVVAKIILSIHHESSQHNKLSIQFITNTSITGIMEVNQSSMLNPWYILHVMLGQENNPRGTKPFMLSQLQIFCFWIIKMTSLQTYDTSQLILIPLQCYRQLPEHTCIIAPFFTPASDTF